MQPLALIVHDIRSAHNVGSIMRTADCFGISTIYFSGYTPYPALDNDSRLPHLAQKINAQIAKTALGAEKTVPFSLHPTIQATLSAAKNDGYTIAVLEQDAHSTALSSYTFKEPTAIVVGNELEGVAEWTKRNADVILEISQYGTKESLNVASATAIALLRSPYKNIKKMNTHPHSHHHIGHSLFIIGIFLVLFMMTVLAPVNNFVSRAIGVEPIIELSNQARSQFDQPPLAPNTLLMSAAQQKAEDMVSKRYFAHFSPDNTSPWDFFKQVGYTYQVAGENLAITNEDETAVIQGWLNSPTHKENLLSTKYRDIGIGIANYGDYQGNKNTIVIVALYGTLASPLSVTGTEPTNPAGTVAALRPAIVGNKLYGLAGIAAALIIAGAALEIRHIRRRTD